MIVFKFSAHSAWVFSFQSPSYEYFTKICVTFNNGHYVIYIDGVFHSAHWQYDMWPINSQNPTTLGYMRGFPTFQGYIDDVSSCVKLNMYLFFNKQSL